ncbi:MULTISPECIES: hypothetical protein [unclassified Pseudomonas]|uniref:hypothetical protein n=1 Tax=unclassified Pseudomonas TaxID=196821 RepID=UPI0015A05DF1|nr:MULTISPECIES: hypothetical protein [unclassified Pseudomonas]NWC94683.1 hypothetical protein [Pseudomonas sp. IPO3779]NWD15692.1 hypothetical protein [Pseudomonas sp. IPO3778]
MTDQYFLKVAALGRYPKLKITQLEFQNIAEAREVLTGALSIEEKYDLTLSNYIDLEKQLLSLTAELMVKFNFDYDNLYNIRALLNQKIANFILSGKIYTEQIVSTAAFCASDCSEAKAELKKFRSKKYDDNLDYKIMEALRNYIAHHGMVLHTVSLPSHWTQDDNGNAKELEFNIDLFAEKRFLIADREFKKEIIHELPERFDLKKGARSYIGCISEIQKTVRRITEARINSARLTIEEYLNQYSLINDGDSFAVGAYSPNDKKPIMLTLEWDNVRINLAKTNIPISNMYKRYATNSLSTKKQ